MKFTAGIGISEASGSVGGVTFSHNRFGAYVRSRAIPVNPGSQPQLDARGALIYLTRAWGTILTPEQRAGWSLYGDAVPLTDSLGQTYKLPGNSWFIKLNSIRYLLHGTSWIVYDAPLVTISIPTISATITDCEVQVDGTLAIGANIVNQSALVSPGDSMVFCRVSNPYGAAVNYYEGPWCTGGWSLEADNANQPTVFGGSTTKLFAHAAGQRLHVEFAVSQKDGRQSPWTRKSTLTATA